MEARQLKLSEKCEFKDCEKPAVSIAFGRTSGFGAYCEEHGYKVADEHYPEYVEDCPNCNCKFGVN